MREAYSRRSSSEMVAVAGEHLGEPGDDRERRAQVVAQPAAMLVVRHAEVPSLAGGWM